MKDKKPYRLAKKKPVAEFWYKGEHTHPIIRAGFVIEDGTDREMITMYVSQEGKQTFPFGEMPIRRFRRDRIAKYYSLRREVRERMGVVQSKMHKTTLKRRELDSLVHAGL